MKKLLFSAAILAAFASCSKNEVMDAPQSTAISFSTLNDRITKVASDDTQAGYKVYADVASATDATAWYFVDDVNASDATSTAQYWPADETEALDFYAYAPSTATLTDETGIVAASAINFSYAVPATAQEDFTIASAKGKTYVENEKVALSFAHKLAKVTVNVVLSDAFAKDNVLADDGAYTANITVNGTTLAVDLMAQTATLSDAAAATYKGALTYYIAPQVVEDCKLQVIGLDVDSKAGVAIWEDTDLAEITLSNTTDADGYIATTSFDAGKHYVFTITVSGDAGEIDPGTTEPGDDDDTPKIIEFSATEAGWGDAEVTDTVDQIVKE